MRFPCSKVFSYRKHFYACSERDAGFCWANRKRGPGNYVAGVEGGDVEGGDVEGGDVEGGDVEGGDVEGGDGEGGERDVEGN